MVLQNYVVLETGRPARMHFIAHDLIVKSITDPVTRRPKQVNTLVFHVDELQGTPAIGYYSIVSDKHAKDFTAYLPGERYRDYDFIITAVGEGFRREYQVQAIRRGPS